MKLTNLRKFEKVCPKKGIYILVLTSKWCKSCKLLLSLLEKFKEKDMIEFKEINLSEFSGLAKELNINAIPALIIFKNGKLLNKNLELYNDLIVNKGVMIGYFNETILEEVIKQI